MVEILKQEVVVITGASAGVGRATARAFARRGAKLGLIARGIEGLDAAKRDVEELGGQAIVISCDVADAKAVEQAAEQTEAAFGPIDIWINAAFAGVMAPFLEVSPEDYKRVTEVTYLGQVYGTMAAVKRMTLRNRGTVVLVGSALAYRGIPLQSAYCGAKHAIQGFQDSLRSELLHARSKVHVSMVQLPAVNTPQFDWIKTTLPRKPKPASPPYQPEVAADAIYYAAHSRRKSVVVGFPTLKAIWGDHLFSSLLDRYLARTAFKGQQDRETIEPGRQNNLYQPVPGDHGAHGRFDRIARKRSLQLLLDKNRLILGTAATLLVALALDRWMNRDEEAGVLQRRNWPEFRR
ncbi:SDR family oxidoreductase (plasmid) [Rhizobium sp. WSM1274]|uniref:SDR family oxidoreductase n=1 Tax=Rhizobium sp. WSM1274 TaxID=3138254 RepID=UPI0021A5BF49|nr:SDR family oxidoreductase [Rhizobium leguminosarum]UWU31720.1 SDR family oxidoreductase [Rhizobium leguminosarum bv. viciae]